MNKVLIGQKIKEIRAALGLNQMEFGEQLGINQGALSQLENGHVAPSLELAGKIVTLGSVTYDWLLSDEIPQRNTYSTGKGKTDTETSRAVKGVIERIKKMMTDENLTDVAFAIRCNIYLERMQQILYSGSQPTIEELTKIFLAFSGYNTNWVFRNKGSKKIQTSQEALEELVRQKDELLALMQGNSAKKNKLNR